MLITFETFAVGTVIFEQIEGTRFPSLPRVFVPQVGTASGAQALINQRPGEEFPGPPDIEFSAPQSEVSLVAGVNAPSSAPVNGVLRAFDAEGKEVAADGPVPIGPGPTSIRTFMQVASPSALIVRVQLAYEGGFAVVIDNLDFDVVGPAPPPDTEAPVVVIRQPEEGAVVTGAMFFLEVAIQEDRKLRTVTLTIEGQGPISEVTLTPLLLGENYRVGPVWTGPLGDGTSVLTVRAEDFSGNVGIDSVTVTRVPIEATLEIEFDGPIVIPRLPGASQPVPVRLQETFPGSLLGRGDIEIMRPW